MAKKKEPQAPVIKRNAAVALCLVCLVLGFYAGSVFQGSYGRGEAKAPQAVQDSPDSDAEILARIEAAEKAVKETPGSADAWTRLGNLYFDSDQPEKSVAAYDRSLALAPGNPDVLTDQGVMYRHMNQPQKALECFDKAAAIDPTHVIAQFNKSIVLLHDLNDRQGALRALEALAAKKPDAVLPGGVGVSQAIKELKAASGPNFLK